MSADHGSQRRNGSRPKAGQRKQTAERIMTVLRPKRVATSRAVTGGATARRRRSARRVEALWPTLLPLVRALAARFAQSARRAGLETTDLEHEAYLKFRDVLHRFVPGRTTTLGGWLWRVLTRHFIGLLRKHRPTVPLPADGLPAPGEADPGADRDGLLAEVQRLAAEALPNDPDRRKKARAFLLSCCRGWKLVRLAHRFGVSVTTAFRWVNQVKQVVRQGLRQRFPSEFDGFGGRRRS